MQTLSKNIALFRKSSAKLLLILAFIFSAAVVLKAQTLDAFNPNANVNQVLDIEVLPDGKILAAGGFTTIGGLTRRSVARLNADGTADATFPDVNADLGATELIVQPDGKILVSGDFTTIGGQTRNRLARLNADGTLDGTFDAGLTPPVGAGRIALQPDGKIILPGSFGGNRSVLRRNADGSADTSFAQGLFDGTILQTVLQPDGKVLACGGFSTFNGTARNGIVRLNANGSLDTTFNANLNAASCQRVLVAPDGKIYITGGFSSAGGQTRNGFARLNADGTADVSFQDPNVTGGTAIAVLLLPNGKTLLGGNFTNVGGATRRGLARLNADGSLDAAFRDMSGGSTAFNLIQVIKTQTDGKILLGGGFTMIDGQTRNRIARIISNDATQTRRKVLDFDGDGKTDFAVTRAAGATSPSTWYISGSGGTNSFVQFGLGVRGFGFTNATDIAAPGDYDGDGKTDIAVFRPSGYGNPAFSYFFILQSNGNVFRSEQFGVSGDNPTIVDDYDADGKADLAVWREGASAGAQSIWYYRPSASPSVDFRAVQWGTRGDFVAPGDYDGDGKADICIYRPLANGSGQYILTRSSDSGIEYVNWGLGTDQINPGDYDGDGKTDFMITRNVSGTVIWYLLTRSGATGAQYFGSFPGDFTAQGDYDGDGRTDIAVWRNSATAAFYVQRSSGSFQTFQWGLQGDYPVAYYNAH